MSYADTQPLTSAPVAAPSYPAVVGATAPANPHQGMIWLDNSAAPIVLKIYDNNVWTPVQVTGTGPVAVPVPANATAPGFVGQIAYDGTHVYHCVAVNTWVRVARDTTGGW